MPPWTTRVGLALRLAPVAVGVGVGVAVAVAVGVVVLVGVLAGPGAGVSVAVAVGEADSWGGRGGRRGHLGRRGGSVGLPDGIAVAAGLEVGLERAPSRGRGGGGTGGGAGCDRRRGPGDARGPGRCPCSPAGRRGAPPRGGRRYRRAAPAGGLRGGVGEGVAVGVGAGAQPAAPASGSSRQGGAAPGARTPWPGRRGVHQAPEDVGGQPEQRVRRPAGQGERVGLRPRLPLDQARRSPACEQPGGSGAPPRAGRGAPPG